MSNSKKKVLITYIEAGLGHIVTAQAIADALEKKYGDSLDIIEDYTLRDSENPLLRDYEKYMVNEVHKHSKYPGYCHVQMGSMYLLINPMNTLKFVHNTVFKRQLKATVEEYKRSNPDLIVCTHYFLLYCAVVYRNTVNPNCKVALYCPDNMVHGWWDNRVDMIYTNCAPATEDALKHKFPKERILEVFYPTRKSVIESNESREFYREKFGIPKDKFAVCVADGVYAQAKARRVAKELLRAKIPLTICLIAGKNEKLKAEFESMENLPSNITLKVFGFVSNAHELYAACDLFITKAGPNAVLDSVLMGTPVIMDYYASPIEHGTVRQFIHNKKCGYYIYHRKNILKKVEELAQNPEQMIALRENLKDFDKNINGAEAIADDLMRLVNE